MFKVRQSFRVIQSAYRLRCRALVLGGLAALTGLPAAAQDQGPDVAFQHGVLIPAFEPRSDRRGSIDGFDPTVIPFSGWQFVGADGQDQAWRRRSLQHSFHHGGQRNEAIGEYPMQFVGVWSYPEGQGIAIQGFRATRVSSHRLGPGQDWIVDQRQPMNCEIRRWLVRDLNQLPDELRLNVICSAGETRTLARFTLGQRMPVTSGNARIKYFGAVRGDGPVGNALPRDPDFFFEAEQPFNLELQYELVGEEGVHWPEFYATNGSRIQPESQQVVDGPDEHYVCSLPMEGFRYATLKFRPLVEVPIDAVDLAALHQAPDAAASPRRVEVPRTARFGPPQNVRIQRLSAGRNSMIDLDAARGIAIPRPLPGEEGLDRYAHENRADLIWRLTDKVHTLHMLASPVYHLPDAYWTESPYQCVSYVLDRGQHYQDSVDVQNSVGKVYLTTTSDGAMVLYRIRQYVPWNQSPSNYAYTNVEIRRIID